MTKDGSPSSCSLVAEKFPLASASSLPLEEQKVVELLFA
jgi:hypothetical protein